MGAPGLTTPLRKETFKKLQLNAGIVLKNFDLSAITTAAALRTAIAAAIQANTNILGATRGGGSFTVTRDVRVPEIDGLRYNFKGGRFVDSADAYLSTTLLELSSGNVKDLLAAADIETSGAKTTITMRTAIDEEDYLDNIVWVGDLADGSFVAIVLYNALNTSDFTLTYTDKGEGTLAAEFHAHQSEVDDYDEAPFQIITLDADDGEGMASITVASAAGTNVGGTKLTISNYTKPAGASYVYKVGTASTAPALSYLDVPDYSWTSWDGSADIAVGTAANGNKITVAAINASGKAIASGNVVLVVKTA